MLRNRVWTKLTRLTGAACVGSVLMALDGCDPEVRQVWLSGVETAAVGIVTAMTSLLTTAVSAFITGATQSDDSVTTVQAAFEWACQVVC